MIFKIKERTELRKTLTHTDQALIKILNIKKVKKIIFNKLSYWLMVTPALKDSAAKYQRI